MSGLDLARVSLKMSPKDRAKLAITLQLKGYEDLDIKENPNVLEWKEEAITLSTEADLTRIANACPLEEAREYNFYIRLLDSVIHEILERLVLNMNRFEYVFATLGTLKYALTLSPMFYEWSESVWEIVNPDQQKKLNIIQNFYSFNVLDQKEKDKQTILLDFSSDVLKNHMLDSIKELQSLIQNIINYIALIEKFEDEYFDGIDIITRNPNSFFNIVDSALDSIKFKVDQHNTLINNISEQYFDISFGKKVFELVGKESYIMAYDIKPNMEWMNEKLQHLVNQAKR